MGVATAVMSGIGLAKGVFDNISASKRQKQHQAELDAYQPQELENVYKNMPVSTIGSDLMREESSRNIATAMNGIGNAGARAIIGATPKLVAEQNNVNRNIQKELDDQVVRRNYDIAGDNSRIQQMQEQRENADLAGLGNAINTARHDKNMGLKTIVNSGMLAASSLTGTIGGNGEDSSGSYWKNYFKEASNWQAPSTVGYNLNTKNLFQKYAIK